MPAVKSILKRAHVEVAKATRTCKNSGNSIRKGQKCLVVHDGMYDSHTYCQNVSLIMIAQARDKLDQIERQFAD